MRVNITILECKLLSILKAISKKESVNITILECKFGKSARAFVSDTSVNITILECKYRVGLVKYLYLG